MAEIGGDSLSTLAGLLMDFSPLEDFLTSWILEVNLDETNCLKNFLVESTLRASHPKSYSIEIKFQAASPMPLRSDMSLALLRSISIFLM